MAITLLQTKLYIPPVRPTFVSRQRLFDKLDSGLAGKLTLISAPPGFGKSTLLGAWSVGSERPVAWVLLDEGDNDPARFWSYIVAAWQKIQLNGGDEASVLLANPEGLLESLIVTPLLNEMVSYPDQVVLVLDDYHLIESTAIHQAMAYFLDHLPPNVHLIIVSRLDPAIPLARLRARGELNELREADLRFTEAEAAEFLSQAMGLALSAEEVALLEEHTEGWITGLHLAALSMQGKEDIPGAIRSFQGLDRYIIDYLVEEVLQGQPEAVQTFLVQTSILDRLSAPLCTAVTGENGGQEMLYHLEKSNLFLESLDDERYWYRYHQLFGLFLRRRLQQQLPESVADLHGRASLWYEEQGWLSEAIHHAFEAGDSSRAATLVEGSILNFFRSGEVPLDTVRRWLNSLPEELLHTRPRLALAASWSLLWAGQPAEAQSLLNKVEAFLTQGLAGEEDAGLQRRYLGELAAIRANLASLRQQNEDVGRQAQIALELLPGDETFLRSLGQLMLGHALRQEGLVLAAEKPYSQAMATGRSDGIISTSLLAAGFLVHVKAVQGQLREARKVYQEAVAFAREMGVSSLPSLGVAICAYGDVLRERNELVSAEEHLRRGIELCKPWPGLLPASLESHVSLARVKQARGDVESGLGLVEKALEIARRHGLAQTVTFLEVSQARMLLFYGDLKAVAGWFKQRENGPSIGQASAYEQENLLLARLLIFQERGQDAVTRLFPLLQEAKAAGRMASAVEILTVQALAWQTAGDPDAALASLAEALALAEAEGFVRSFVDEGESMEKLLRRAAARGIVLDYTNYLLDAFRAKADLLSPTIPGVRPLSEPLTERELEVLRLIAAGLTNRQIAEDLVVALGTVKAHINSIYRKLDASNRVQAVSRARDLNLL